MLPLVSVIVPAYRATDCIGRALGSVARAGVPPEWVEVIVASDDGVDYAPHLPADLPCRCAEVGVIGSGPGAARNRALSLAQGRYVAFLDADDTWEDGYLSGLLPLLDAAPAVFAPTSILIGERELMRLPEGATLGFAAFASTGASFHPVVTRAWAGPFARHPSQDILHALEVLSLLGGRAALGRSAYQLRLNETSVTRSSDYAVRVAQAYTEIVEDILCGRTRVPVDMRVAVAEVYRAKFEINAAYADTAATESFYEFVARRLQIPPAITA